MRRRRPIIVVVAAMAMLVVSQAMPVSANTPTRFGSKLDDVHETTGSRDCDDGSGTCTWIMNEPFNSTKLTAPKDGTIHHLRVVAGAAGSVTVQLARVNGTLQGKIVRKGATIHPVGKGFTAHKIESFPVSIPVKKGDRLAIKSASSDIVRCDSGGPNTLEFLPALPLGGAYATRSSDNGCWLMLQAEY